MRIKVFAPAAVVALALAGSAFAQMAPIGPGGVNQSAYQYIPDGHAAPPEAFTKGLTALSYRTLAVRAEDGGKLTPAHQSDLQQELNQLARKYRVMVDYRIRR